VHGEAGEVVAEVRGAQAGAMAQAEPERDSSSGEKRAAAGKIAREFRGGLLRDRLL
jgi:hypothetical protein